MVLQKTMVTIEDQQRALRKAEEQLGVARVSAVEREQEIGRQAAQVRAIRQPGTIEAQFGLAQQVGIGQVGRVLPESKSIFHILPLSKQMVDQFGSHSHSTNAPNL